MADELSDESIEEVEQVADSLDNLVHAMELQLSPDTHLSALKELLPELRDRLRRLYIAQAGYNPWED